jgi:hypothetical protein
MGQKFIITESEKSYIRGLYSHLIKEIGETGKNDKCQEWITQNFSNVIPYDEVYVGGRCKNELQEYAMGRINALEPIKYAESFLPEAKQFYIDYFDYTKTPEIIDKIITISQKNGKPTTKENVIRVIESMKTDLFGKVGFAIDFLFNKDNPETIMYTLNNIDDTKIYICGMSDKLFVDNYEFGNADEWRNSIQHELGHLIDFWFLSNGILLHKGVKGKGVLVPYPHQGQQDDEFLYWGEYQRDTDEQFVRFKMLFDILSKHGLTITSDLNTFINVFKKVIDNKIISFEGCSYTIQKGIITIDENCESLKDRSLYILTNGNKDNDLTFLFSNYTKAYPIESASDEPNQNMFYQIDLNVLYNDWKNEYVMNRQTKQTVTSGPNYPTA